MDDRSVTRGRSTDKVACELAPSRPGMPWKQKEGTEGALLAAFAAEAVQDFTDRPWLEIEVALDR